MRKDSLLYIFRCIFSTCPVAGWDIPITPTPPVSSLCRSVGLDKPALLVIRLSFGFVSDSICQAQRMKTETAMLSEWVAQVHIPIHLAISHVKLFSTQSICDHDNKSWYEGEELVGPKAFNE